MYSLPADVGRTTRRMSRATYRAIVARGCMFETGRSILMWLSLFPYDANLAVGVSLSADRSIRRYHVAAPDDLWQRHDVRWTTKVDARTYVV